MKKLLVSLVLIMAVVSSTFAQDIDQFISDLSKLEGVQHQRIDREMLDGQLKAAAEADPSGKLKSQLPPFLEKIDLIEVVVSEDSSADIKNEFASKLSDLKVGEDFETLLKVKEEDTVVQILLKKEKEKSTIYVLVTDEDDIVAVKMYGDFTEEDITNIVKEQQKNLK